MKIKEVSECGVTFEKNKANNSYVHTYRVAWEDIEVSQDEAAFFVKKNLYTRVKTVQKEVVDGIDGIVKYRISWDETLDWEEEVKKHKVG